MPAPTPPDLAALLDGFQSMAARLPHPPRARDAAEALGTSEGWLTEARRSTGEAVALAMPGGPAGLIDLIPALGAVMALARNADCVLEIEGRLDAPRVDGARACFAGSPQLDLDLNHWAAAYALTEETRSGRLSSLQIFDRHGDAVLKLYPGEAAGSALEALTHRLTASSRPSAAFVPASDTPPPQPKGQPVPLSRLQPALEAAAAKAATLRISIANRGCRETFTGRIETVKPTGAWLNVLDPGFNMHLRADRIARLLLRDGGTLVACRADDAEIVQFAGDGAWRRVLDSAL